MLHSTLSALLVSVASRYAQLSPSDVGIGIGGGRLVIDNVQLRAHTFNGPNIPFHVHQGRAGRLRINVPWSALSSTPVRVYLENVHLIAGPKQLQSEQTHTQHDKKKYPSEISSTNGEWHQTMVGRLLFNVSVEIYGLKIEYRDDHCVGIVSVASLRANSAGPDWNPRFVSLLSDLDPQQPEASAVSMRKLLHLSGVHWVMIPRKKGTPLPPHHFEPNAEARSPRLSELHLDLKSYESQSPILDGISLTVRVLFCTGMALVRDSVSPGLHAQVDVDLEEPIVNLTAQQIKWIDQILKKGLGIVKKRDGEGSTQTDNIPDTKRRPRPSTTSRSEQQSENAYPTARIPTYESGHADEPVPEENELEAPRDTYGVIRQDPEESELPIRSFNASETRLEITDRGRGPDTESEDVGADIDDATELSEDNREILLDENDDELIYEENVVGGFRSFWEAIVGEYADETVDDAAIALGLTNGYISAEEEQQQQKEQSEDDVDSQYARAAVNAAAVAGGLTFKLRLRTPDLAARDEVERLREELHKEREMRLKLEDVESVLHEAEDRVKRTESDILQLKEKNVALVKELNDLEKMTSQAGKNKDAMIRQMEAALMKAEKNLQAMYQERYEQRQEQVQGTTIELEMDDSSPKSVEQDLTSHALEATDGGAELVDDVEITDRLREVEVADPLPDTKDGTILGTPGSGHVSQGSGTEASPTTQTESSAETLEQVSLIEVTESEKVDMHSYDRNNSVATEPVTGAPSDPRQHLGNEPVGMMSSKHLEQAMSSEGLTLV